mmetsp:Transcript_110450/g.174554  ORF Transcript_110450/g.174554 Transcript_110450/m.174554 type:complete len:92 (+) Transcript_110450:187-462(+)
MQTRYIFFQEKAREGSQSKTRKANAPREATMPKICLKGLDHSFYASALAETSLVFSSRSSFMNLLCIFRLKGSKFSKVFIKNKVVSSAALS